MMTITEKLEMFKEKKTFIENISKAFEAGPKGATVSSINYEAYRKETKDMTYFVEYVIVTFFGGGKSVKCVNGNSNTANFRALGSMLDGGYYDEVFDYDKLTSIGYEKVIFEEAKKPLDEYLEEPMKHISDVARCFDYCANGKDVVRVIKMIPSCFGSFTVEFNDDGESFRIINYFEEDGVMQSEEYDFDFYVEEE